MNKERARYSIDGGVDSSYETRCTERELNKLAVLLKIFLVEIRVPMEYTERYHEPTAKHLREAGMFFVFDAILARRMTTRNTMRKAKTDGRDATKLANMYQSTVGTN